MNGNPSDGGRRPGLLGAGMVVLGLAYWFVVRPWHLRWGATEDEANRKLPGDELIPHPAGQSTHAISIETPPEDVWPWLVQLGQGRGGFYSYDWLENLFGADIHNVDRIVPEYQNLAEGDVVRLAPPDYAVQNPDTAPIVARLEPERALVLRSPVDPPRWTWAFTVHEYGEDSSRLIVRMRSREPDTSSGKLLNYAFWEPAHFVMERKMLDGIKTRVERRVARERSSPYLG